MRGGNIRFDVVDANETESGLVTKHLDKDSLLMTDTSKHYSLVAKEFLYHGTVDHSKSEYVKEAIIHTNTLEGAFSLLDRMIIGIYHSVTPKHLQAYCNESGFRYNSRKITDKMRFDMALVRTQGVKLPYSVLIAK